MPHLFTIVFTKSYGKEIIIVIISLRYCDIILNLEMVQINLPSYRGGINQRRRIPHHIRATIEERSASVGETSRYLQGGATHSGKTKVNYNTSGCQTYDQ